MPFVDAAPGRLYYEVHGPFRPWVDEPQTIVFHHGVAASSQIWADWIPVLASRFRVVTFDMRAFGASSAPPPGFDWSFGGLVSDLRHVVDTAGAERFHLVGESIGGTAAIAFALAFPERVSSLTLSNAAARGGRIRNADSWRGIVAKSGQATWARQMMDWRFYEGALSPEAHAWYLDFHASCPIGPTLDLVDVLIDADFTSRLKEISLPTLLLCPDSSPFIAPELMLAMRAEFPDCEMQVFAHAKHGMPLSHAEALATVLRDFLARRFPEAGAPITVTRPFAAATGSPRAGR